MNHSDSKDLSSEKFDSHDHDINTPDTKLLDNSIKSSTNVSELRQDLATPLLSAPFHVFTTTSAPTSPTSPTTSLTLPPNPSLPCTPPPLPPSPWSLPLQWLQASPSPYLASRPPTSQDEEHDKGGEEGGAHGSREPEAVTLAALGLEIPREEAARAAADLRAESMRAVLNELQDAVRTLAELAAEDLPVLLRNNMGMRSRSAGRAAAVRAAEAVWEAQAGRRLVASKDHTRVSLRALQEKACQALDLTDEDQASVVSSPAGEEECSQGPPSFSAGSRRGEHMHLYQEELLRTQEASKHMQDALKELQRRATRVQRQQEAAHAVHAHTAQVMKETGIQKAAIERATTRVRAGLTSRCSTGGLQGAAAAVAAVEAAAGVAGALRAAQLSDHLHFARRACRATVLSYISALDAAIEVHTDTLEQVRPQIEAITHMSPPTPELTAATRSAAVIQGLGRSFQRFRQRGLIGTQACVPDALSTSEDCEKLSTEEEPDGVEITIAGENTVTFLADNVDPVPPTINSNSSMSSVSSATSNTQVAETKSSVGGLFGALSRRAVNTLIPAPQYVGTGVSQNQGMPGYTIQPNTKQTRAQQRTAAMLADLSALEDRGQELKLKKLQMRQLIMLVGDSND
mmetsp:Transcript_2769/g.3763  ORF Transcript_2769/g.3763 Transcript_2769/m.3763 type:complete len:629 (-) Transcript_2769:89-1975(-)